MKIYVAAHDRWAACHVARQLTLQGVQVVSTWHNEAFNPTSEHTPAECAAIAQLDTQQIAEADAVVLIAGADRYTGGKFVEAGIAVGQGKRVVILGRRENMLLWLPQIRAVAEPTDLLAALLQ